MKNNLDNGKPEHLLPGPNAMSSKIDKESQKLSPILPLNPKAKKS